MLIDDIDQATDILIILTDANTTPILTGTELVDLLAKAEVASLWRASTSYRFGAVVQPTAANRNGHRYKLIKRTGGSTSGLTEPTWPDGEANEVTDGNLTWQEAGADLDSLWDLNAAARAGWLLKAGKAVTCTDFEADGLSMSSSQVYKHCIEQSKLYCSVTVA